MDKEITPKLNQNHIILGIFEFDCSPDVFTNELNLEPLEKALKGDKFFVGSQKEVEKIHEYNIWTHELKKYSNEFIGNLVAKFIDEIIKPRIDTIIRLTKDCNVQLRIVQYYYEGCNPGLYIRPEHIKLLGEINCSIDIDLYCLEDSKTEPLF